MDELKKIVKILTFQQKLYEQRHDTSWLPLPTSNSTAQSHPGAGHHLNYTRNDGPSECYNVI